jgi:hypothetical protein
MQDTILADAIGLDTISLVGLDCLESSIQVKSSLDNCLLGLIRAGSISLNRVTRESTLGTLIALTIGELISAE